MSDKATEVAIANETAAKRIGITAKEARRLVEEERAQRLRACEAAIQRALAEHGCQLVAVPGISGDGRIVATVKLQEAG